MPAPLKFLHTEAVVTLRQDLKWGAVILDFVIPAKFTERRIIFAHFLKLLLDLISKGKCRLRHSPCNVKLKRQGRPVLFDPFVDLPPGPDQHPFDKTIGIILYGHILGEIPLRGDRGLDLIVQYTSLFHQIL